MPFNGVAETRAVVGGQGRVVKMKGPSNMKSVCKRINIGYLCKGYVGTNRKEDRERD